MNGGRYRTLLLLLLAMMPLLAGCWDFQGLEQRAFALTVGIDRLPDNRWRMTTEIQLTGGVAGDGGQGDAPQRNFRVVTGEGVGLRQAFEDVRSKIARELDFTFADTIIIGREAATNLRDLDWVVRTYRVPVTSFVAVARGTAEEVVRANTPGFSLPGFYTLRGFSGIWTRSPTVVRTYMWTLFNLLLNTPLEDPYAPVLTGERYGLNWDGLAVFRGSELVGFLPPNRAAIFNVLKKDRFQYSLPAPQFRRGQRRDQGRERDAEPGREAGEGPGSVFVQRGQVRRWVSWEAGGPVLHLRIQALGDLRELPGGQLEDQATQSQVEEALSRDLEREVTQLILDLQRLDADPLGFGELARRAAPYRPEVQSGEAWHRVYRQARIDAQAQVKVISSGFIR